MVKAEFTLNERRGRFSMSCALGLGGGGKGFKAVCVERGE